MNIRDTVSLMRELGIVHLKSEGIEILLGDAPAVQEQEKAAPKLSEERGPDGLTPSEQEDLYGTVFEKK